MRRPAPQQHDDGPRAMLARGRRADGCATCALQLRADGGPVVRRTAQLRSLLDRRAATAPGRARLSTAGPVAQRVFDARALAAGGAGDAALLLHGALREARGAGQHLLELAQHSPLFDVVLELRDSGPPGATSLHYRDDDTRVDLESAARLDPARARQGGLVMRIGVNRTKVSSDGAVLQTLVHEVGVHAAAFAGPLHAVLHGPAPDAAADALVADLGDLGALSPSIQHILYAGGEADAYEELSGLLKPRLGPLRTDFLAADDADREQHLVAAKAAAFGVLLLEDEAQPLSAKLSRALEAVYSGPAPPSWAGALAGPSTATNLGHLGGAPLPWGGVLPPLGGHHVAASQVPLTSPPTPTLGSPAAPEIDLAALLTSWGQAPAPAAALGGAFEPPPGEEKD